MERDVLDNLKAMSCGMSSDTLLHDMLVVNKLEQLFERHRGEKAFFDRISARSLCSCFICLTVSACVSSLTRSMVR